MLKCDLLVDSKDLRATLLKLKKDEDNIKKAQEDYKKQSAVMNDAAKMKKERENKTNIQGAKQQK
jgi:hypothetical protein